MFSSNRIITLYSVFIFFCFTALNVVHAKAQVEESVLINGKEVYVHEDRSVNFKMFLGRNVGDQTYLIWVVPNMKNAGTFIICRSGDGENYEIIGVKPGGIVTQKNYTGYYFIDRHASASAFHYKVMYLDNNNSCFRSGDIRVLPSFQKASSASFLNGSPVKN